MLVKGIFYNTGPLRGSESPSVTSKSITLTEELGCWKVIFLHARFCSRVFCRFFSSTHSLIVTSCLVYFDQEDVHTQGHVVNDTAGVFVFKQITGFYPNRDYSELPQPLRVLGGGQISATYRWTQGVFALCMKLHKTIVAAQDSHIFSRFSQKEW